MSDGSDLDLGTTYTWDDYSDAAIGADASNLTFGTNPAYTVMDFLNVYPQFGPPDGGPIPPSVLQMYVNLASASVSQQRWCDAWQVGMALFIAHFATLYVQSVADPGSTSDQIALAGAAKGILVSKSAGGVSGSYQSVVSDLSGWVAWKLTIFGQQFLSMGRLMGLGGMYVY